MALDKIRLIASYERKIIRRHLSFWIFLICIVFGIAVIKTVDRLIICAESLELFDSTSFFDVSCRFLIV